ncbi:hypothetical protein SAMN05443633_11228 [Chryseobacterium arachidis]|uniref:Peptidase family M41 n=2 Tax=Chryseobacterium arachidis TaxID=1416778 RepID=A0A1M5I8M6_9FLAO|nr:hypothetical protein [Chryseobacterium arachidis]SHG24240.1 hypothetical protein SAMN05443633_11228 [Chryseobacterium arachidis]
MPFTELNDIAIHEAGHVIVCFLMSDLARLHLVTIDAEHGKTFDPNSDGGLVYKYLKQPKDLDFLELDQFCLLHLAGLAADLVNEQEGPPSWEYFLSEEFFLKINQFYYQGDMISFSSTFDRLIGVLQVAPQHYNLISIQLLVNIFSNRELLEVLLALREFIDRSKTIDGEALTKFLNDSYLSEYKRNVWPDVKEMRRKLFVLPNT